MKTAQLNNSLLKTLEKKIIIRVKFFHDGVTDLHGMVRVDLLNLCTTTTNPLNLTSVHFYTEYPFCPIPIRGAFGYQHLAPSQISKITGEWWDFCNKWFCKGSFVAINDLDSAGSGQEVPRAHYELALVFGALYQDLYNEGQRVHDERLNSVVHRLIGHIREQSKYMNSVGIRSIWNR